MGLLKTLKSSLLAQIKQEVEAKVPPELKRDYLAVVVAGMKLMFSQQTHPYVKQAFEQIRQRNYDPKLIAHALIKALSIIHNESQGKMNQAAAFPAVIVLMCYALEYLETTQDLTVTNELISQVAKLVTAGYFHLFKIDPSQIQEAVTKGAQTPDQGAPPVTATQPPLARPGA